jgi:FAD/FMN-containing dehydrogenase
MFSIPTSILGWLINSILLLSLFLSSVFADTCATVEQKYPDIQVIYPGTQRYNVTTTDYWSIGCAALKPTCVIYPRSAQQMSTVVKALKESDEPYAIKSGGHNPNKWMASVQGGPLISTALLNEVVYNRPSQTVRFGPGQSWENITDALQTYGVTVVGGRIGNVGVGGYMLGGENLTPTIFGDKG